MTSPSRFPTKQLTTTPTPNLPKQSI